MCSYIVEKAQVAGSAKGPSGWMRIDTANVYFDHPYHAPFDHALAIDFVLFLLVLSLKPSGIFGRQRA